MADETGNAYLAILLFPAVEIILIFELAVFDFSMVYSWNATHISFVTSRCYAERGYATVSRPSLGQRDGPITGGRLTVA